MCVQLSVTQTVIIAVNTVNEENQPGRCCCMVVILHSLAISVSVWLMTLLLCCRTISYAQELAQGLALYHPTECMTGPLLPSCLILYTSARPHTPETHTYSCKKRSKKVMKYATTVQYFNYVILLVIFVKCTSLNYENVLSLYTVGNDLKQNIS